MKQHGDAPRAQSLRRSRRAGRGSRTSSAEVASSRISTRGSRTQRAGDADRLAVAQASAPRPACPAAVRRRAARECLRGTRAHASFGGRPRRSRPSRAEPHVGEQRTAGSATRISWKTVAMPARLAARGDARRRGRSPAISSDAGVRAVDSGEDLDQRALAGAVLSHHGRAPRPAYSSSEQSRSAWVAPNAFASSRTASSTPPLPPSTRGVRASIVISSSMASRPGVRDEAPGPPPSLRRRHLDVRMVE